MKSANCEKYEQEERKYSYVLRCHKDDENRGKFWDNYWFRITPANLQIHPISRPTIEEHTICMDDKHRLEAYPPN